MSKRITLLTGIVAMLMFAFGAMTASAATIEQRGGERLTGRSLGKVTLESSAGQVFCDVELTGTLTSRKTGVILDVLEPTTNTVGHITAGTNRNCTNSINSNVPLITLLFPWPVIVKNVNNATRTAELWILFRILLQIPRTPINCLIEHQVLARYRTGELLRIEPVGQRTLPTLRELSFLGCFGLERQTYRGEFRLSNPVEIILS